MGVYKYNATDDELNPIAGATTFADCAIGSIIPFGGNTIPKSFLLCDGAEVSKTEYADLYAVIGDAFGTATEATNFRLPDLRECAPVGAGKNITQSIGSHDRFNLGQFKDDQLQNFVISQGTRYQSNTASAGDGFIEGRVDGGTIQIKSENATTGRFGDVTRGKRLGVNFIIKAKHSAYPADMKQAVEEVMDDYQTKDLATPLTIGGTNQTTVEGALGGLNNRLIPYYSRSFGASHDRYIKIGTLDISDSGATKRVVLDLEVFSESAYFGYIRLNLESRYNDININGETNINIFNGANNSPSVVISKDTTNGVYVIYLDTTYSYLFIRTYVVINSTYFNIGDFTANASFDGTLVFDSTTNVSKIAYIKADTYSTTETLTNKVWIDGKPIYRKVWEVNVTKGTAYAIDISGLNMDIPTNIYGFANLGSQSYFMPLNSSISSGFVLSTAIRYKSNIQIRINGDNISAGDYPVKVVLEYTKTT